MALWLSYGMFINAKNVTDFGQSTVESIVDQHKFSVEALPNWPVNGDSFGYQGRTYMNKQPGQAMVCAVVYAHLKMLGFSYAWDRVITGGLVIFFSASLLLAVAGVALFRLARDLDGGRSTMWPLGVALIFGWGTTAFAYSGIAHHDIIALSFLVIAFYLIFRIGNDPQAGRDRIRALVGGLLLGLTLTTSMTLFFMAAVIGLYFLSLGRWKLLPSVLIGGFIGVIPMLFYNAVCFGNPFTLPMTLFIDAPDNNVFFSFDWTNFLDKLHVYFAFTNWYTPVLWFGVIGLVVLAFKRWREALTITAAIAVLVFYVTNIRSLGTCNYGPRYMLPMMPFASLGIIGLHRLPIILNVLAACAVVYVGIQSVAINLVGAMGGAMYCNIATYAYPDYVAHMKNGEFQQFLLMPWLLPFAAIVLVLVILKPILPDMIHKLTSKRSDGDAE